MAFDRAELLERMGREGNLARAPEALSALESELDRLTTALASDRPQTSACLRP